LGQWVLLPFQQWPFTRVKNRFAAAEDYELRGYLFWGPVAAAIIATELVGFSSSFEHKIPWFTISSTVGHLQDIQSLVALVVVAVIAMTAFYALAYGATGEVPKERPNMGHPMKDVPVLQNVPFLRARRFHYGWPTVLLVTILFGLVAWLAHWKSSFGDDYFVGYVIYSSFALFGIVLPLALIRRHTFVHFPTLFVTVKFLRMRWPFFAVLVIAGLAILVIHLAMYPWPNLAREPGKYAGLTGLQAQAKAEAKVKTLNPGLEYSARHRDIVDGRYAWRVYFTGSGDEKYNGCVVVVRAHKKATASSQCS
jgi:hypothetical protein